MANSELKLAQPLDRKAPPYAKPNNPSLAVFSGLRIVSTGMLPKYFLRQDMP